MVPSILPGTYRVKKVPAEPAAPYHVVRCVHETVARFADREHAEFLVQLLRDDAEVPHG